MNNMKFQTHYLNFGYIIDITVKVVCVKNFEKNLSLWSCDPVQ